MEGESSTKILLHECKVHGVTSRMAAVFLLILKRDVQLFVATEEN
jgi:hypothetical protein